MVMTMVGIEFKQYNINIGTHALKYTKKEKSSSSSFNTSSRLASMQPFVWYKWIVAKWTIVVVAEIVEAHSSLELGTFARRNYH